jgi:hypothetical protein
MPFTSRAAGLGVRRREGNRSWGPFSPAKSLRFRRRPEMRLESLDERILDELCKIASFALGSDLVV